MNRLFSAGLGYRRRHPELELSFAEAGTEFFDPPGAPAVLPANDYGEDVPITINEIENGDYVGDGTHSITDDSTNTLYALRSAGPDLDAYVDQPVNSLRCVDSRRRPSQ